MHPLVAMRKTSQDGADTTSITSGIENEIKKPGIMKTKRNSIKRKVQSLSHESDDAVIEPLLQKDKEKTEMSNQSAKYDLLSKTKTDVGSERGNDKEKLLQDDKTQKSALSNTRNVTDTIISIPSSSQMPKSTSGTAPLHNHMNTNVFNSHDALKGLITTKSQILVEIDKSKQSGYNPSRLIFTTAKIHTDGKNKHLEPLQVTPVPILSTIEVSVLKGSDNNSSGETSGLITSNISSMYPKSNASIQDKDQKLKSTLPGVTTSLSSKLIDSKASNSSDKQFISSEIASKDKKVIDISSVSVKNFNVDSKFTANKLQDHATIENKSASIESKKDKDGKQTKLSLSQPISGPSSEAVKTNAAIGINKPSITAVNTKGSLVSQVKKDGISVLDQSTKKDKSDDLKSTERKTDLNKNITSTSWESSQSDVLDSKPNSSTKGKIAMNAMSTTKQLQRQKTITDKDDATNTKLQSGINSSSQKPETIKISDDSTTSIPKSITQVKPSVNDVNMSRVSQKTKLPISTANNIQISSNAKPSVTNITTTTGNKASSNSIIPAKSIVTTNNTIPQQPKTLVTKAADPITSTISASSTGKSLPSSVTTVGSDTKHTDILSLKPQTTQAANSKSSTSGKTANISTVKIPYTTSQPLSTDKSTPVQPSTNTIVAKSVPQVIATKATDFVSSISTNTVKNPSVLTNTVQSSSASIAAAKIPTLTTNVTKSTPVFTSSIKDSPTTTSATKVPPVSTYAAKSTPLSTSSLKGPSTATSSANMPSMSTNTVKSATVSTSSVKSSPATTSVAKIPFTSANASKSTTVSATSVKSPTTNTSVTKIPPLTANAAKSTTVATSSVKTPTVTTSTTKAPPALTSTTKSTPVSTSSVKTPVVQTSTSKAPVTKSNIIPIGKGTVASSTVSSSIPPVSTVTTTAVTGTISNSVASNKKTETKSTELSNGNKSLKA